MLDQSARKFHMKFFLAFCIGLCAGVKVIFTVIERSRRLEAVAEAGLHLPVSLWFQRRMSLWRQEFGTV
jgi:hypothetical protein